LNYCVTQESHSPASRASSLSSYPRFQSQLRLLGSPLGEDQQSTLRHNEDDIYRLEKASYIF